MKKSRETLLITRSSILRRGLIALLESLPNIMTVKAVEEVAEAYAWIEAHQPDLVLLDSAFESHPRAILEKIIFFSSQTKRVLLVDNVPDLALLSASAEAVLIQGVSPSALAATLNELLSMKGAEDVKNDLWQPKQVDPPSAE